jgi:acid phosphatase (class A)
MLKSNIALAAALIIAGSAGIGSSSLAQTSTAQASTAKTAGTMARPMKTLKVLTEADVNPARILSAPPADGSDAQKRELALVQEAYNHSSPARKAQAEWDDKHEDAGIFAETLGPAFDLARLPETAKLLALVLNDQSVAANMAKRTYLRTRPWAFDPAMKPCDYKPNANPKTSFPSGHATLGYSVAYVLGTLIPERAQALQDRAGDYAFSRLVCGDHYPSDVEASKALGVAVGVMLMHSETLAPMIAASRTELAAAHLTAGTAGKP